MTTELIYVHRMLENSQMLLDVSRKLYGETRAMYGVGKDLVRRMHMKDDMWRL